MTDIHERIARLEELMDGDSEDEEFTDADMRKLDELRADRNEEIQYAADVLAERVIHALVEDIGPKLTCIEAEAFADLYRALGRKRDAAFVIDAHSYGDNETDDAHYRSAAWVAANPLPQEDAA